MSVVTWAMNLHHAASDAPIAIIRPKELELDSQELELRMGAQGVCPETSYRGGGREKEKRFQIQPKKSSHVL